MDQVCTHYSLLIVHNSFLNVVRSHPCHWFGLISTLSTVEWTSVSNPIHESAQLLDWSINNCLLKSLGFLSVECLVLNPRLDKGRRRRWYNRRDKSMYNTCQISNVLVHSPAGEQPQTRMSCTLKWNYRPWICDLFLLPCRLLSPSCPALHS